MSTEAIRHLEEKIAYLERHVVEQDKAMLELAEDISVLRREVLRLRNQAAGRQDSPSGGDVPDERPPHY